MLKALLPLILLGACSEDTPVALNVEEPPTAIAVADQVVAADPPTATDAPPVAGESADEARQILEEYFARIAAYDYAAAWALRWHGRDDDAASRAAFANSFAEYVDYRATVGAPGAVQGAAGSLYVEVPVQIYGNRKDGLPISNAGTVTLRRVNDVPGSTAEERRWRIYSRD